MSETLYIYAIQHNVTEKIYIGKAKNIYKRYEQHLKDLRAGNHRSDDMQNDFDKYGEDFSIYILEKVENGKEYIDCQGTQRTRGTIREVEWMKKYNTTIDGYNAQDHVAKRIIDKDSIHFPLKEGFPKRKGEA